MAKKKVEALTKKVLADKLAAEAGMTKKAAAETVNYVFETMAEQMKKGGEVDINGFGKFSVKKNATLITLTGTDPMAENNFDAQPIQPQTSALSVSKSLKFEAKPYSFSVIKIKL